MGYAYIGGQQLEVVAIFTYFGNIISLDGDAERDDVCHIGKVSATFQKLCPVWKSPFLSLQIKLQFLAMIIAPTATYVCETWKMTESIARKLDGFHLRDH